MNPFDPSVLPPYVQFDPPTHSHFYGAGDVAARYCGLADTPNWMNGRWVHGWHPDAILFDQRMFTGLSAVEVCGRSFWVATPAQAQLVRLARPRAVEAVGVPLIYLPPARVSRRPGSLLVMPVHSLEYTTLEHSFEEYAKAIESVRGAFSEVVVCIHRQCYTKNYWVDAFTDRGIPVIVGADANDRNGLARIQSILSYFEFMTTNGFGSHLAYAAYLGCRPSIYGPFASLSATAYANDPLFRSHPDLLAQALDASSELTLRRHYPFLFTRPSEANDLTTWGAENLGLANKRSPAELRLLFGWTAGARILRRVRASTRSAVRGVTPEFIRRWRDNCRDPAGAEISRLRGLPRFTPGQTELLGLPFVFDDPYRVVREYQLVCRDRAFDFISGASPVVIEGGAGTGLAALHLLRTKPTARILLFEPDTATYQLLLKNLAHHRAIGVRAEQVALWTQDGTGRFFQGDFGSRRLTPGRRHGTVPVPTRRLRDLLAIEPVDLLKLNIAGAEREVLADCRDVLHQVRHIYVEYHSRFAEPDRLPELLALLTEVGYRVHLRTLHSSPSPFVTREVRQGKDLVVGVFGVR